MVKKLKFADRGKNNRWWTWARINDQDRPVQAYRDVTKGKHKGEVEVTLFDGKKKILPRRMVGFGGNYSPTKKVGTAYVYEFIE